MINEPSTAKNQPSTIICWLASGWLPIVAHEPLTNPHQPPANHHQSSIINQPTVINHHQPTSIINQHQPTSISNHHQPTSINHQPSIIQLPSQLYSSPCCRSVSIARIACTAPWLCVAGRHGEITHSGSPRNA